MLELKNQRLSNGLRVYNKCSIVELIPVFKVQSCLHVNLNHRTASKNADTQASPIDIPHSAIPGMG